MNRFARDEVRDERQQYCGVPRRAQLNTVSDGPEVRRIVGTLSIREYCSLLAMNVFGHDDVAIDAKVEFAPDAFENSIVLSLLRPTFFKRNRSRGNTEGSSR